jgi:hypothetical protein
MRCLLGWNREPVLAAPPGRQVRGKERPAVTRNKNGIFREPKGRVWRYQEVRRYRPDPYDPGLGRLVAWGEWVKKRESR